MNEGKPDFAQLNAADFKFVVVCAQFNSVITEVLLAGAMDALKRSRRNRTIEVVKVPGAWELPLAAKTIAEHKKPDAIIALGAVIRGDTPHFDYRGRAGSQRAGGGAASETGIPVAFGVLTTDTIEQATDRAGGKHGNKGYDAAIAAIEMADLIRRLRK